MKKECPIRGISHSIVFGQLINKLTKSVEQTASNGIQQSQEWELSGDPWMGSLLATRGRMDCDILVYYVHTC